ncbi:MAG TPA: response regulator [Methanoregula sp.]|nr:response regulator [Methanoregula sp.]
MNRNAIIIVDDDAIVALRNHELLTKSGYVVPRMFASGEDLLDYLDGSAPPDLILMDVGLDGRIDGIETARRVRKRSAVPFIFLSSVDDDRRTERAQEVPDSVYMVKPVIESRLMEAIGSILGRTGAGGRDR